MPLPKLMAASNKIRDDLFRKAVQAQIDLWDNVRSIETLYGVEFRSIESEVEHLAIAVDCGEGIGATAIANIFDSIEDDDFTIL